jgi:hypothetical protein
MSASNVNATRRLSRGPDSTTTGNPSGLDGKSEAATGGGVAPGSPVAASLDAGVVDAGVVGAGAAAGVRLGDSELRTGDGDEGAS